MAIWMVVPCVCRDVSDISHPWDVWSEVGFIVWTRMWQSYREGTIENVKARIGDVIRVAGEDPTRFDRWIYSQDSCPTRNFEILLYWLLLKDNSIHYYNEIEWIVLRMRVQARVLRIANSTVSVYHPVVCFFTNNKTAYMKRESRRKKPAYRKFVWLLPFQLWYKRMYSPEMGIIRKQEGGNGWR